MLLNAKQLETDADLASVAQAPQFQTVLRHVKARDEAFEAAARPDLKAQLLAMVEADQAVVREALAKPSEVSAQRRVEAETRKSTEKLKSIVDSSGWPGFRLVGHRAAKAAWLLLQHSADLEFQMRCLARMKQALAPKDVNPDDVALLEDRVLVRQNKPQIYGSQFQGVAPNMTPLPIADEAQVDERRAAVGLEPLAEYRAVINQRHSPAP